MSTFRTHIARHFVRLYTHPVLRRVRRAKATLVRKLTGRKAQVHYFHQADDPYSHLCVQVLQGLAGAYDIRLIPHLVNPPQDSAAPERVRLAHWSLRDAGTLARVYGLHAPRPDAGNPSPAAVQATEAALTAALDNGTFIMQAAALSADLWNGHAMPTHGASAPRVAECKAQGDALRKRNGHYLGGTFYYGGEWYWGLDRLHHLEERLREEGLCRGNAFPRIAPVHEITLTPLQGQRPAPDTTLDYFCSFRSPYTYLALPRARALAAHYGAHLRVRFVLPMVMRGLPVPVEKRLYIVSDVAREAQRLGLPFGNAVDPVGKPVERGYALLHRAIAQGKGVEFAASFLQGVWADGLDAGTDAGLNTIAARAGFDVAWVQQSLRNTEWQAVAAANREELLALDLWGVPSFRVNDLPGQWGQDRLWVIEQELRSTLG
ncbi:MAG: DsbA family protein [Rhodoferax sp.]